MLLHRDGIDCVVLEARDRAYVEKRVRAGLLEQNTVNLMRELGVDERLDREGLEHDGIYLRHHGENHYIDMTALTGRHITIYGQQEVVKDMTNALLEYGVPVHFEVGRRHAPRPRVRTPPDHLRARGPAHELTCDAIAGCDGFHGVSRPTIREHLTEYEYVYPFGWLGILAEARPATDELIYAWHERGFALYTMRSQKHQPALPPGPRRRGHRELARRPDLGRAGTRLGECQRGQHLREGHHPDALVRGRADAVRPPVPGRRLRPHRPADRGQGA